MKGLKLIKTAMAILMATFQTSSEKATTNSLVPTTRLKLHGGNSRAGRRRYMANSIATGPEAANSYLKNPRNVLVQQAAFYHLPPSLAPSLSFH